MKKIALFLFITLLFAACEKDKTDSLANTKWTSSFDYSHQENGKTYDYTRDVELVFTDETKGSIHFKEKILEDNIKLDAILFNFNYTYSASSGKGIATFAPNSSQVPFTVSGNKLKISALPQGNMTITLEFTKQ